MGRFWLVWVGLSFVVARAEAQSGARFALHYARAQGAESCVDPRTLARKVEALTGPRFVSASQADVTLEARIAPLRSGFRAHIFRVGPNGEQGRARELSTRGKDCRRLDAIVSFVIALMVDPALTTGDLPAEVLAAFAGETPPEEALLAELEATPAVPYVLEPEEPAPPPPAPPPPTPPPAAPVPIGVTAAVLGSALFVTLPQTLYGGQASVSVDLPRLFPLTLSARGYLPEDITLPAEEASARVSAFDVALAICPLGLRFENLRVRGCAGTSVGRMVARGSGFPRSRTARLWDNALVASLSLWLEIGRGVGLWLEGGGRLRFQSSAFEFRDEAGQSVPTIAIDQLGFSAALGPIYEF